MVVKLDNRGFTLIELMVTITVAAILIAAAVPTFQNAIARNSVQSDQRVLRSDLGLARAESISRGQSVVVCGSADGTSCNDATHWSDGWIVFVDDGSGTGASAKNGKREGSEEILKVFGATRNNAITLKDSGSNAQKVAGFNVRGYLLLEDSGALVQPSDRLTIGICEPGNNAHFARAVVLDVTGRIADSSDSDDNGISEDANGTDLQCASTS